MSDGDSFCEGIPGIRKKNYKIYVKQGVFNSDFSGTLSRALDKISRGIRE